METVKYANMRNWGRAIEHLYGKFWILLNTQIIQTIQTIQKDSQKIIQIEHAIGSHEYTGYSGGK